MEVKRKIIHIDEELCDGCGACVPACAEGALEVVDGKARVVSERYCDGLGACIGDCPKGALSVEERVAEEFDEEAVEEHLSSKTPEEEQEEASLACGCPSTQIHSFSQTAQEANEEVVQARAHSALSHWPVQIRLVPPTAPFLKDADLLVAADCTPVAYPNFHQDFLKGRVVMIGCPKFDEKEEYIQKFADIFRTAHIKSVTVLIMEVPCCSGLPTIVKKAMDKAGKRIPMEEIVIGPRGDVLSKEAVAAS